MNMDHTAHPEGTGRPHCVTASLEDEYHTLMSTMEISVSRHLLDEHFTVVWANDYFYEKLGYTREEYAERFQNRPSLYFQACPEYFAHIRNAILSTTATDRPRYDPVCRMPRKDGTSIWVRIVGALTKEVVNGIPLLYVAYVDVDDLIRTQQEQSVTYDNLPGFVAKFRVGQAGAVLVEASERYRAFFGSTGADTLFNLDTPENRANLEQALPDLRAGRPVHFAVQAKNSAGEDAWLQLNGACVDWVGGEPVYLMVYIDITDITQQRALHHKLEERTDLLRTALEMAEQASQAKSDFLSRMSHDIRTPMNAILGMLTIAEEAQDDRARVADCLGKIHSSAEYLLCLINDILDMSKIESGKTSLKKAVFQLDAFVRKLRDLFCAEAARQQIRFTISADAGLEPRYVGDALKLSQIVINLLSNALHYTPPGGRVDLHIAAGRRARRSAELIFTVRDTGIGIAEEFRQRLFLPFEQERRQTGERTGSGLGLAIAGNYARMMNGGINVESTVGVGSTFSAHLWLDLPGSDPEAPRPQFGGKRVLLAMGSWTEGAAAAQLFQRFGVRTACVDIQDAMERLTAAEERGDPFHLLVVGLDAPGARGPGAHGAWGLVRTACRFRRAIAVAGCDRTALQHRPKALGLEDLVFLQTPLHASAVYDCLAAVFQGGRCGAPEQGDRRLDGQRVLLVEDNDMNLEIAQVLLESRGLQVETARDGRQAVAAVASAPQGHFWAVLMDIQMPEMDGLAAARAIRALPPGSGGDIPILAMSANAFDEDVERSLQAGMDAHLSKPIDINLLMEALQGLGGTHASCL